MTLSCKEMSEKDFSIFCRDVAKKHMADAFAYAVQDCGMDIEEFYHAFISTGMARSFEEQEPKYVLGYSGREIVHIIQHRLTGRWDAHPRFIETVPFFTPEYWLGWTLVEYQWKTKRSFEDIAKYTSVSTMLDMYMSYHEMAPERFFEKIEALRGDR